jgi:hypothetical protein
MGNLKNSQFSVSKFKHCGESIDHLLLHCEVVAEICNVFFHLFGVNWVMPRKVSDILEWCFWRERNARSFEDNESGMIELRKLPIHTLFSWSGIWSNSHKSTFSDFLELCFLISKDFPIYFFYTWVAPCCAKYYLN